MDASVSLEEFDSLQSSAAPPVVIDIRREVDYQADAATIPGALRGDPDALDDWASSLPRDKEIVVYCVRGGSVSQSVTPKLQERGLKVRYLTGGIEAWKRSGGKTNQAS